MSTEWIYRVHMFVRLTEAQAANRFATDNGPGGDSEENTFSTVRLSSLGTGTETDLGCSTLMTQSMFDALQQAVQSPALASLRFYAIDASTELLLATNSTGATDSIGSVWSWQRSSSDLGLNLIHSDADEQEP